MFFSVLDKDVHSQINNFKKFIMKYKIPIICSFIFSLICFGFMLTNYSLTIDEETWINSNSSKNTLLWLMQGRFGIFIIDKILSPTGNFVPFLWDFLSVVIWNFSGVCFLFCVSLFYPKFNKFSAFAFCAYFSSVPLVVGELLSYSMFNFQQSLGMLFMAISIFFIYTYFNVKRIKYIIISSIFLLSAASIYQAFVVVYIVMIIAYVLICSLNSNFKKIKETITNVIQSMLPFIIGVLIYFIVNKIITTYIAPDPNNYLNGYIGWNKGRSPIHVILTTFHYIEKILFGDSIVYGGKVLLIITCLFLIFSVTLLIKIKEHTRKFIAFITSILLLISPFTMAIILGSSGVNGRTYVALPLAGAIELLLIINKTINAKFISPIVILATVFILLFNSMYMNRLFYNSFMVYKHDSTMGSEIIHDISMYGYNYSQNPIVFIGMHDVDRKIFSYNSGSTGGSFFSWDDGNNTRIVNFLRSEGYDIIMPSTDEIKLAYSSSKNLSNWPRAHSIKQLNNFIIVKLSTPTKAWMSVNGVK